MATQSLSQIPVSFNGMTFLLDVAEGNLMSLNDIYVAAGSPAYNRATDWLRYSSTIAFIEKLSKELNVDKNTLFVTKRGKGGSTFAHIELAKKYKEYLSLCLDKKEIRHTEGLYALMFSNGIIKVGKSIDVLERVRQHESNAKAYGLVIIDRYLVDETDLTEQELLSYCRGLASKDDNADNHHGEYFIGINFDKVKKFLGYKEVKVNQVKTNVVKKNIFKKQQESLFV